MSDNTTGDPKLDAVVMERFSEAIDVARQVLKDRHPDISDDDMHKTAALIIVNVWQPLAHVVIDGIKADAAKRIAEREGG